MPWNQTVSTHNSLMANITADIPRSPSDADFLVDCAVDYAKEALRNTGMLPRGTLLSADMLTLVVHRGNRQIGALSSVTGTTGTSPRTEIDSLYFLPRWRGKGYVHDTLAALKEMSPLPLFLRGPVHPSFEKAARELEIITGDDDTPELETVTEAVLSTISCPTAEPGERPCDGCVSSTLRNHFTQQCTRMIVKAHAYEGVTA